MRVEGKPEMVDDTNTRWFVVRDAAKHVGQSFSWSLQIRMRVAKKRKLFLSFIADFHF